uniref:NADH-ubiquinone oxidoreductase chain 4 n=1 Tax=Aeschyntelus notatus TaxID=498933 RepID=B7SM83_9HEMI|nr:NADH dehydrogenase subunit 4 [Aeschyntelus notatus]ABZ01977.1 NADH dehydrogenase subunit 4 [Aeschyntelus notatus]
MMKIMFIILFLIPLLMNWWIFSLCFCLLTFYLLMFQVDNYLCYLSYGFGFDVVSYCMIILTFWVSFLMIMASFNIKVYANYVVEFLLIVLFLIFMLFLTFTSSSLFLFYLFFESSMIFTLFLIFGWGYQPERFMAGLYLLFYTLFASFPLLISIFYIFDNYNTLFYFIISIDCNIVLYFCLIMAFLVKMPMIFLHFWLPKAHVEAPISGSMILAGVLLKLGGYGLFRVFYFMNYLNLNYIWIILSLFGVFVVGLLCMVQIDMKAMIAYSSVAHMGLVICGIMVCNYFGLLGSLLLMIGHGLCSSGMFVLANIMYEHSHSRSLFVNKGFISFMPTMSMFWFMFMINNMAAPPSLNLLGEILLINGIVGWSTFTLLFLAFSSFFSCCYSIYLYSITQHGVLFSGMFCGSGGYIREYMMLFFHWFPLNFLIFSGDIFIMWL